MADPIVSVIVTRSAGTDGALLVMIDTAEELVRIMLNDVDLHADVDYELVDNDELRDAGAVIVDVTAEQVAYL